ncbi:MULTISPECIES: hypothetical protein [Lysobacter]|uniref:DUF4065 domain-containing protein n=1 Tax=Lysobacter firmicutimachus TaxID=1792846 RepID=A0ABU8D3Y7_9GAMM|nr:hypothetical protein [Lysobacter antibioticus]
MHAAQLRSLSYWATHYKQAPFYREGLSFSDYAPAIYLGIAARGDHPEACFKDLEAELEERYAQVRQGSRLNWIRAVEVAEAAWHSIHDEAVAA